MIRLRTWPKHPTVGILVHDERFLECISIESSDSAMTVGEWNCRNINVCGIEGDGNTEGGDEMFSVFKEGHEWTVVGFVYLCVVLTSEAYRVACTID